jgi:hypothetical protein
MRILLSSFKLFQAGVRSLQGVYDSVWLASQVTAGMYATGLDTVYVEASPSVGIGYTSRHT